MDQPKRLDILLALYIGAIVASELMGAKTTTLLGINMSVAIFTFPLTFTINDIVSEVFGKERARSFVRSGLITLVALAAFTALAVILPPTKRFAPHNDAFREVFTKSLRIMFASLSAFAVSEFYDVYIYNRIREKFGQKRLWLRNNLSNFISQLVDTVVFMFLAFYVSGNALFVVSLIIPYWLLKCLASVVETPLTYLGVRWLRTGKT